VSCRGLYFVGLPFLYFLRSALVGGVGRDAEHIVDHIASTAVSKGGSLRPELRHHPERVKLGHFRGVSTDSSRADSVGRARVFTDLAPVVRPGRAPSASACACEPYREL
jgi:hypothetical protein